MQVLFVFIFWLASVFSGTPNQPGIKPLAAQKIVGHMPVKLLAFSAKTNAGGNILEWQTTSEINTREFIIERSADGKDFSLMFWVTPKGTPTGPTFYRYIDSTAGTQAWYRLRMVDADGKEQVSRVILVNKQLRKS